MIHADGEFPVNEIVRVKRAGTGIMLIQRKVLKALAEAHPEWRYKVQPAHFHGNPVPSREYQYDFFQMGVKDQDYLPEDFFFCDAARELGFDTWIIPWARTRHTGICDYFLDLPAVASLEAGAATEANATVGWALSTTGVDICFFRMYYIRIT